MKMLQYLFLLQVLFVGQLFCLENLPNLIRLENAKYPGKFSAEKINPPKFVGYGFKQELDHFDQENSSPSWTQLYFVSDEYYKPGGPIFIRIENENFYDDTAWTEYAKKFGAKCFLLVHRYYGDSKPTPDTSTENLQYLTSEQALADAANFISQMNIHYKFPEDVKWIAFGGSYSGSLAAWLRLKYPHLVYGAVASSALLEKRYYEFYEIIKEDLNNHKNECGNAFNEAFVNILQLVENREGQEQVSKQLRLCKTEPEFKFTELDVETLKKELSTLVKDTVLLDDRASAMNIFCTDMTNQTLGTPLQRFSTYLHKIILTYGCFNYQFDDTKLYLANKNWSDSSVENGERQWFYQMMTELNFFPTSGFKTTLGYSSILYYKLVPGVLGHIPPSFTQGLTTIYGGVNIDVTNVVFVQGSADPWKYEGVQKNVSSSSPLIVIEGGIHASDTYVIKYKPPSPQIEAAKRQIETYIESWINA